MAWLLRAVSRPFARYNALLESHPLTTKSLTSGVMYAAGDAIAQAGEHWNNNKDKPESEKSAFAMNWRRVSVFFLFGTFIGGPLYHAWFGYLDTIPGVMLRVRTMRQRREILSAYALLKRHGIEVNMRPDALPSARPFSKWTEKGVKIAMDQFVFSSTYTLLFFVAIGMMNGAADKMHAEARAHNLEDVRAQLTEKYAKAAAAASAPTGAQADDAAIERNLLRMKALAKSDAAGEEIDRLLDMLRDEMKAECEASEALTWATIWAHTWEHTKEVYWPTYVMDCIVWPPVQLINFTFVPLRYQVLYVNAVNLGWNTFLSVMANKHH